MDDLLSDDQVCDILLSPWNWRVVSSLFPSDISPINGTVDPETLVIAARHYDSCMQICIFLRGRGEFCIGGSVYPVAPASVFFVDAFEHHSYHFLDPRAPGELYRINVLPGYYLARYWAHREGLNTLSLSVDEVFTDIEAGVLIDAQWKALRQSPLGCAHVRTRLVAATAVLTGAIADRRLGQQKTRSDVHRDVVAAVRRQIIDTLGHKHSLDDLARFAGYSESHLSRLFRHESGQSIHEYIDSCRLARVQELLGKGRSQKQIATELGFSSATAYAKWRRKQRDLGDLDALKYFVDDVDAV